ncbi:hypothetical protein MA16_Dca017747 [Dendrobium catenatum]|uniref:Uncharacterized protein n=1 Tax=Dendrobium catenatum TaxID=906689 RepID=A0A2I0W6R4_9ASPA|nr:hypothetical protein MA16_Dca017747 [Dendrobium catenatum]
MVVLWKFGTQVVVQREFGPQWWSSKGEGFKWWFGGATTSSGGPAEVRDSSGGLAKQRR